jgi:transcriptional regulator
MYPPTHYAVEDPALLLPLMKQFNFAVLVTLAAGVPYAHLLPFQVEVRGSSGSLLGHLAPANLHWRHFAAGTEALAIFQGAHAYISPSWYTSHPNVPTWNYLVVHAYGIPRIVEDEAAVYAHLQQLVQTQEAGFEVPWEIGQAEEHVRKLMRGIVAFELPISRLEGKFKLSQNKTREDRAGVIAELAASDDPTARALAQAMQSGA